MSADSKTDTHHPGFLFFLKTALPLAFLFTWIWMFEVEAAAGLSFLLIPLGVSWVLFYWSPASIKPFIFFIPFFFLLVTAFGWVGGLLYLSVALFFIGWNHIPGHWIIKWVLLLAVVGFLLAVRLAKIDFTRIALVIPYLASAFMFRFIIYTYDIKYIQTPIPLWQRFAYFLQPGNLVFLLYPIIDFRNFLSSYATTAAAYRSTLVIAVERITRAVFHSMLYRIIYMYLVPPLSDVQDGMTFWWYCITAYALILRISTVFYFSIGFLGLFGFNLPDIFNFYFLPSGFVQLWRRINIYWRDFIVKIFYYPFYFKMRKIFPRRIILVATLYSFIMTCLFHSYQVFWLGSNSPLRWVDVFYWMLIGVGVAIGAYLLDTKKIKAYDKRDYFSPLKSVQLAFQVIGMFLFMSVLWYVWQSKNLSDCLFFLQKGIDVSGRDIGVMLLILLAVAVSGGFIWRIYETKFRARVETPGTYQVIVIPFLMIVFTTVCISRYTNNKIEIIDDAFTSTLNEADMQEHEQGYYGKMLAQANQNPWEMKIAPGIDWAYAEGNSQPVDNLLLRELKPNMTGTFRNISIRTNAFGMRDKEYDLIKDKNTIRFMLVGGSYEVGSGVKNEHVYESITESEINRLLKEKNINRKIEIMNMAMGGYHLPQVMFITQTKTSRFKPDYIIYAAHEGEIDRLISTLSKLITHGVDLHFAEFKEVKQKAGLRQYMSRTQIKNRLKPYGKKLFDACIKQFCANCRAQGAQPVLLYVPALAHKNDYASIELIKNAASGNKAIMFDLSRAFGNREHITLQISVSDNHPNPQGHQLLANEWIQAILNQPDVINVDPNVLKGQ